MFGALDVTKPYEFIRFGALDVTKPYEFIGFGLLVAIAHLDLPIRTNEENRLDKTPPTYTRPAPRMPAYGGGAKGDSWSELEPKTGQKPRANQMYLLVS